jgi:serine/threonine protein kinase
VLSNGTITDVKISDFGSVLNLGSDVTQIYRVGSLAYMSPEQLDGGTLDFPRRHVFARRRALPPDRRPAGVRRPGAVAMMQQIYHAKPPALTGRARRRQHRARRRRSSRRSRKTPPSATPAGTTSPRRCRR